MILCGLPGAQGHAEVDVDKIAIIGLGLIGGSIGLALKEQKDPKLQVIGFDAEVDIGTKAQKRGAVDKAVWRLPEAVEGAQIVIIATPVLAIREVLQTIAEMLQPGAVVTDTGGTKSAVMAWAKEYLPQGISFIGGNPLTGKDVVGIEKASPALFHNSRYVLIPDKAAHGSAVQAVVDLVSTTLKAKPYFMDADEHDSYAAAVAHLPMLLAQTVVGATSKSPSWKEMSRLAASGFEAASSLAGADPLNNLDICITNREAIVHWANEAIREMARFRDLVSGSTNEAGAEALGTALARSWEAREVWHTKYLEGDISDDAPARPSMPSPGEQLADFMIGAKLRERYQQMFKLNETKEQERRQRRFRRA